ncbi:hypothetical protein SDC9_109486 [bioreactor metagenome]|uniref:Uncharacterized protein n=1 Tax=bioreactor metagenome TaxID=1076179 RepID=A0A645BAW9_9ZZZZ
MRAVDKLRANESLLSLQRARKHAVEGIPTDVVISISRGRREVTRAHALTPEGLQHALLGYHLNRVDSAKDIFARLFRAPDQFSRAIGNFYHLIDPLNAWFLSVYDA